MQAKEDFLPNTRVLQNNDLFYHEQFCELFKIMAYSSMSSSIQEFEIETNLVLEFEH